MIHKFHPKKMITIKFEASQVSLDLKSLGSGWHQTIIHKICIIPDERMVDPDIPDEAEALAEPPQRQNILYQYTTPEAVLRQQVSDQQSKRKI